MKDIVIPESCNYIAAFLTFSCNYNCNYCINSFGDNQLTKKTISGEDWVKGLNRIISRADLPVTLQGGEPSLHRDFIYIINNIKPEQKIDILTNLQFDLDEFIKRVKPGRLKRDAPYASIRVSYHPDVMRLDDTLGKTIQMLEAGFSIGIWGILYPALKDHILEAQERAKKLGIDFRTKEFLGNYNGKLYGEYLYPGACEQKFKKKVLCKTTELIIGPDGSIFRCHSDLYGGRKPIGNILNPKFQIEDKFRECSYFGNCNPCDIKVKTNRFQQFGHTSVQIKILES